jgi:hypothetical protein
LNESVIVPWSVVLAVGLGLWTLPNASPDVQYLTLSAFLAVWVVVGGSLVRPPRVPLVPVLASPRPI